MKIIDTLKDGNQTVSFEFFPPKDDVGFDQLYKSIAALKPLKPSHVSVTYGAGGSTRQKTVELVKKIKHEIGIEALAHLTCVGADRTEIVSVLDELEENGIENVLALRGDPPHGEAQFTQHKDGFGYASELAAFIKSRYSFCLAGACYPETHPEAPDATADLDNLSRKVDAGIDFLITQLFFNNDDFLRFRDRATARGISIPILAGIMPILSLKQVKRFTNMCGATIPTDLLSKMEAVADDVDAVRQLGTYHAVEQCIELVEKDVAGLHFYTLNRSTATRAIYQQLKGSLLEPTNTN